MTTSGASGAVVKNALREGLHQHRPPSFGEGALILFPFCFKPLPNWKQTNMPKWTTLRHVLTAFPWQLICDIARVVSALLRVAALC